MFDDGTSSFFPKMVDRRIKSVAVVVKPGHAEALATAHEMSKWLERNGLESAGEPIAADENRANPGLRIDADMVVVLGGDGTMISTARMVGDTDTMVLGVNYGGLGYLTEVRIEEMYPSLDAIMEGRFGVDRRVMLDAELRRDGNTIASGRILNDVVINKSAIARIIRIEARLDHLFVNSFRADGLIVSTPTGSTAYNLSAGGPIVYPSMNAVVLTPICPFTLTNRPIVVPDHAVIELTLENENEGVVLSLDGQIGHSMVSGDTVHIRKSSTTFNLIQPGNRNYFDVLRDKLKWGR